MATSFPGCFSGYKLTVTESHQSSKVDTSGTAKAVVKSFQKMGLDFSVSDIAKVRDDAGQRAMGVPAEHLAGACGAQGPKQCKACEEPAYRGLPRCVAETHAIVAVNFAGHAYHTYHLTSPDGSVNMEFQHNVCGRVVYAEGTVDAVLVRGTTRAPLQLMQRARNDPV